jgi:hypothetical protein
MTGDNRLLSSLLPRLDDLGNMTRCISRWLMRPNPHYLPAELTKASIGIRIARTVGFDLGAPESGVLLWPGGVEWTPVPEASIDENGDTRSKEYDVCDTARFAEQWHLQAVAKAQGM